MGDEDLAADVARVAGDLSVTRLEILRSAARMVVEAHDEEPAPMTEISPEDLQELVGPERAAAIERCARDTGATPLQVLRLAVALALKHHSEGPEGPRSGVVGGIRIPASVEDDTHLMLADDYAAEVAEEPAEFLEQVGDDDVDSEPPSPKGSA